jgi:hypothetical protein
VDINAFQEKMRTNSLKAREIIDAINTAAKENNTDIENTVGIHIEALEHNEPAFYLYLIQLQFLKGTIDSNAVFYLYFYWLHTIKEKRKIDFGSLVSDLGKTAIPSVGFKMLFVIIKPAYTIINQILKEYEEYNPIAPSKYMQFRENFWKYIANDKERLNMPAFERKYRIFECFKDLNEMN